MRLEVRARRALLAVSIAFSLGTFATALCAQDDHGAHEHAAHGHDAHAADDHDAAHAGGGHDAHGLGEVNWFYGILGENAEVDEPSLLYRTPGMPVPLLAQLFNTFLLFYLLYRFGKAPVMNGLRARREAIMKGIDAASKMKAEAQASLDEYEAKLQRVDQEIERVRKEMREAAEAERVHILEEAKRRRERMERDARLLIEQELKAAREILLQETARNAVQSAERIVSEKADATDHQRLSDEYLANLQASIQASGLSRRTSQVGGAE